MRLPWSLPPLTIRNVSNMCAVFTAAIFLFIYLRSNTCESSFRFGSNGDTDSSVSYTPPRVFMPSQLLGYSFREASPGETIHIEGLTVELATAVHNDEYTDKSGFQISLNGWVRDRTPTDFKCCLLRSLPNGKLVNDVLTEAKSEMYHIYMDWIVDRQNAEFSCSVPSEQISAIGDTNFSHVTFAKDSCRNASKLVLPILHPKPVPNSVCVCLKITYGNLTPTKIIEWFEYTRHMGVTKVFTYYAEVPQAGLKVLQYYQSIGFLELLPIEPAVTEDGEKGRFRHPRFDQQAWVDEVMAANDCKYRFAKYDFILIMDMDEIILPKGEMTSYIDILQATKRAMPEVCAYSFDMHVVMLDWGATRSSPINLCRFVTRTEKANYESFGTDTKWAFRPSMTYWARNNYVQCKNENQPSKPVSNDMFIALHYRKCKDIWQGCDVAARVNDDSILKYELPLIDRILSLPLKDFVSDYDKYISSLVKWKKEITPSTDGKNSLK